MTTLVLQISPRRRLRASQGAAPAPDGVAITQEYSYALSPDGLALQTHGQCAASLLPKAETVVAVLGDADVSWHRITLPKAPAARLRAAVVGVLEEALLEETDLLHFAVAPGASGGQPAWIATMDRAWLRAELGALEKANVFVDRIVPVAWPDDPPCGHFAEADSIEGGPANGVSLTWAHPDGVACMRLHGGLPRAVVPVPAPHGTRWSATPGAAAAAEQWLGTTVNVMPHAQRLLQAARTLWNLRQFDLARKSRGTRALRDAWRQVLRPEWRPLRWGLALLVAADLIGLNLWALHQRAAVEGKRQAMFALVKNTFTRVSPNDIRRAPTLVMQRETDALRLKAGKPGETDFEPMLQAAAAAWPAQMPPVDSIKYEPGKLTLASAGWREPEFEQFRTRLRPAGWVAEQLGEGRVTITRASPGVTP